jgi:hypothetical protein
MGIRLDSYHLRLLIGTLVLVALFNFRSCMAFKTNTTSVHQVKRISRSAQAQAPYLVHTESNNTFSITDRWLWGHFNSSHVASQITEGGCYRFDTEGVRVPLLSWYPNILSVHPTSCPKTNGSHDADSLPE